MFSAGLEAMFAPKMGKSFFAGQLRFTPTKRDVFTAQFSSFVLGEFSYVRAVTRHLKVASSLVFAKKVGRLRVRFLRPHDSERRSDAIERS
jgi:hypothetical protein